MPIARTYMCPECAGRLEIVLSAAEWDKPPPTCPICDAREMAQEFKPPAIGGSNAGMAAAIAEDILATDYNVANVTYDNREGGKPKVRYKDQGEAFKSSWGPQLQQAIQIGRQTRLQHGSGMEILSQALKTGAQPDLIEASKRRAIRVY